MSTIKDVAKQAGVSISTVSRVMNGTKAVSPVLRVKVEKAIEDLEFSANSLARGLKVSRTKQIAVIVPSLSRIFFTSILRGIHQVAGRKGYSVIIAETYDSIEEEIRLVDLFAAQWVDGILLASSVFQSDETTREYVSRLSRLSKKGCPIPVVTLEFPLANKQLSAVVIDHEKAAYEAVTYLIKEIHCKNIVHISHPFHHYIGAKRIAGYQRAMKEAGLEVAPDSIQAGNYSSYSGYKLTKGLLKREKLCDGIFFANDEMAVGGLQALQEAGIRVPDQIALIGVDDVLPSAIVSPSLTSIHIPKVEMGAAAMTLLCDMIEKETRRRRKVIKLDYELIERGSTKKGIISSFKDLNW